MAALIRLALAAAGAALSAGCATNAPGPLSLSLTELGSEVRVDGGSFWRDLQHRRSHNVTGLGAADAVGMLSTDPDPPAMNWPFSFARESLPDQLALRLSPACSRVVFRDTGVDREVTAEDVLQLRDGLQRVQAAALELGRARLHKLLVDEGQSLDTRLRGTDLGAGVREKLQKEQAVVNAAIAEFAAAAADEAGWQALLASQAALLAAAQKAFETQREQFERVAAKPGLVIARWEYAAHKERSFAVPGLATSGSSNTQRNGYVVLGQPRTVTLLAGDDLATRVCKVHGANCGSAAGAGAAPARTGIDSLFSSKDLYTTTFQLLARHVAWTDAATVQQQAALGLKLKALAESLTKISGASGGLLGKLSAVDIDIGYADRVAVGGENLGALGGALENSLAFTFDDDVAYAQSVEAVRELNKRHFPIASMRTTLDAFAYNSNARLDKTAASCEGKAPSPLQVRTLLREQFGCATLDGPMLAQWAQRDDAPALAQRRAACTGLTEPAGPAKPGIEQTALR